jgi:hypothetical protein
MADKEILELVEQIKKDMDYLGVSRTEAAYILDISPGILENYLNGFRVDREKLRKLELYLREKKFYKGYTYQDFGHFTDDFKRYWEVLVKFKGEDEVCEKTGLGREEVNQILENEKQLDVREQYDSLEAMYELFHGEVCLSANGYKKYADEIYSKLGLGIHEQITEYFADTLDELLQEEPFSSYEQEYIAGEAGVPVKDFEGMLTDDKFPIAVGKKLDVLHALQRIGQRAGVNPFSSGMIMVSNLLESASVLDF